MADEYTETFDKKVYELNDVMYYRRIDPGNRARTWRVLEKSKIRFLSARAPTVGRSAQCDLLMDKKNFLLTDFVLKSKPKDTKPMICGFKSHTVALFERTHSEAIVLLTFGAPNVILCIGRATSELLSRLITFFISSRVWESKFNP